MTAHEQTKHTPESSQSAGADLARKLTLAQEEARTANARLATEAEEHRATVQELRESQELLGRQTRLFDTALSSIADYVFTCDLEGRITYANRARLLLWGKELPDVMGKTFFELDYPPELAARIHAQIETVISTGQPLRAEAEYTGASGQAGYYDYILVPVFGSDGQVELVTGSTRNITDRRRVEKALQASEEQSRDILESITDAFFALDRDWHFTYVNRQAELLLDRAPGDLLGKASGRCTPDWSEANSSGPICAPGTNASSVPSRRFIPIMTAGTKSTPILRIRASPFTFGMSVSRSAWRKSGRSTFATSKRSTNVFSAPCGRRITGSRTTCK